MYAKNKRTGVSVFYGFFAIFVFIGTIVFWVDQLKGVASIWDTPTQTAQVTGFMNPDNIQDQVLDSVPQSVSIHTMSKPTIKILATHLDTNDFETPRVSSETIDSQDSSSSISSPTVSAPVVQQVIEVRETIVQSGITEAEVETKLQQLNNKLAAEIYNLSSVTTPHNVANNYKLISQTQKIDKLSGVTLNNTTFTGTVTGLPVAATVNDFTDLVTFASGFISQASSTVSSGLHVAGSLGVGTSSPSAKLSVTDAVATAQYRLAYDDTQYADFQVDSAGDLIISPSGGDIRLNDENLYVCAGGACASGTPVGTGNIIVETSVGIGTSTPSEQLGVQNNIWIGGGGAPAIGTATSTFEGDVVILGKIDVGTIDPVYTIDGTKYATYGHSTVGVREEVVTKIDVTVLNKNSGYHEYEINFNTLEEGSDLWLFYQVTDFGKEWEKLIVTATPSFDGRVFYSGFPDKNRLVISSTEKGAVSLRLIANRFDSNKWKNLRPDQDTGWKGFILNMKNKIIENI